MPSQPHEILKIQRVAQQLRACSDVVLIVGIGGSYLGAKAAIELLQGCNRHLHATSPQIIFTGNTLTTAAWNELMSIIHHKDISIVLVSKSGTTMEPAIATRLLLEIMQRKYGHMSKKRIVAITDIQHGALRQAANQEQWETFTIPQNIGGRYSVLTAVGLLPMAIAGINPEKVLAGARYAQETYAKHSIENPAWQYAAARNALYRNGKLIEILVSFGPEFQMMSKWWQQLFGESEGKNGKGLFPVTAEFTTDLHSIGQMIQQGQRNMFETMVRFEAPSHSIVIPHHLPNNDNLNYLAGKTMADIDEQAFQGTVRAHTDGGVPVITMQMGTLDETKLGEIFYFFELCCGLSAYTLGVNPFD